MADFDAAFASGMRNEGGIANNPIDKGGLTYKGVACNYWPKWAGWRYVDQVIAATTMQPKYDIASYYTWAKYVNNKLAAIPALQKLVVDFYRANFWNANRYGEIEDQKVATWCFDRAVNCGSGAANKMLQRALGIPDDGAVGPQTIKAVNAADLASLIPKLMEQGETYYSRIVERDPSQQQFLAGWLKRVKIA